MIGRLWDVKILHLKMNDNAFYPIIVQQSSTPLTHVI